MISSLFSYTYMRNAFLAAVMTSIVCGIIGTIIVEKRLVMMSGGIAHTSFGGIGMGYFLGIEPIIGALIFSIIAAFSIAGIRRRTNTNSDSLIGMFWAIGMALGIMFIAFTPGYPPDMTSYLFGDILTVSNFSIKLMGIVDVIVVITIVSLFNYWKAYLFDDQFTKVLGIPTLFLENFLFILIALTIVVLIKVVGIILVIALLTIPPAIAKFFTYNLKKKILLSIGVGMILSVLGLFISYQFNIASGATIILLNGAAYFTVLILNRFKSTKH
ncbi:metal ABC transporter permease [Caldisalinibacter kiritimatiensis]|uniref:Zinc ABC transporter, inner membrane permease protein ZnuB n=1 Tax=Caldisalinibacter kiritimatiensis TaxID=1304284 RepID=R1AXY3_9FIRM|nr:metal ABC transporter permease [Caldisalinibacter kiritimatiensis]EOD01502.1 Zinc ABC transporter, inner membrane permease protein ZnuB [Caldisalinibacter kiritimatiensis]